LGFSISLLLGSLISPIFLIPAGIYLLFILGASATIASSLREFILLLCVLPTMHFAWGAGFISSPKTLVPSSD
jgi:hypothetical protein